MQIHGRATNRRACPANRRLLSRLSFRRFCLIRPHNETLHHHRLSHAIHLNFLGFESNLCHDTRISVCALPHTERNNNNEKTHNTNHQCSTQFERNYTAANNRLLLIASAAGSLLLAARSQFHWLYWPFSMVLVRSSIPPIPQFRAFGTRAPRALVEAGDFRCSVSEMCETRPKCVCVCVSVCARSRLCEKHV